MGTSSRQTQEMECLHTPANCCSERLLHHDAIDVGNERSQFSSSKCAGGTVNGPAGETPPDAHPKSVKISTQSRRTRRSGKPKSFIELADEPINRTMYLHGGSKTNLFLTKKKTKPPLPAIVAIFPGADNLPAFDQSLEVPPHHERNPKQYQAGVVGKAVDRGVGTTIERRAVRLRLNKHQETRA